MNLRRKALIVLLSIGTLGGFASGFAHLRHCGRDRHAAFEDHVADVCTRAAQRAAPGAAPAAAPASER